MTPLQLPENTFFLIPSYRCATPLKAFLTLLKKQVPNSAICVVDDDSRDNTQWICESAGVIYLYHKENLGKGAALDTGFRYLISEKNARWVITMDADGQHSPGDLFLFCKSIADHPEAGIHIGARTFKPGQMPLDRVLSNRITSGILSCMTQTRILDSQCGYRCYSADFLKKIRIEYKRFEMESEVILKARFLDLPVNFVPVQTLYLNEKSNISHVTDTIRWTKAVLSVWLKRKRYQRTNL